MILSVPRGTNSYATRIRLYWISILMHRTAAIRDDHNLWSIIGGKIEYGELAQVAAVRENKEEKYIGYV